MEGAGKAETGAYLRVVRLGVLEAVIRNPLENTDLKGKQNDSKLWVSLLGQL